MSIAENLADVLDRNIRFLSTLIVRKPPSFTSEWAATPDEAFSLYTRTTTVNWALSFSNILAAQNWPFPAYLDLKYEMQRQISNDSRRVLNQRRRGPLGWFHRSLQRYRDAALFAKASTDFMSAEFQSHSERISLIGVHRLFFLASCQS
jgi:hypothetical protein